MNSIIVRTVFVAFSLLFLTNSILAQPVREPNPAEKKVLDKAIPIIISVLDKKVRVDMKSSMSQLTSIFDRSNNRMYMLMPSAKIYVVSPLNVTGKARNNTDKNRPKMEKTNEKKIIKRYNCVKWIIRDKSGIADAWMTNEIGRYTAMGSSSGEKSDNDWQEQMEESGNFPMLVVQKNKTGKETSRLEVKSVNKKNIKDSLFKVPDGYKEMLTGSGQ